MSSSAESLSGAAVPSMPSSPSISSSTCACGQLSCTFDLGASTTTPAMDCHCPKCRKYHVAAFASYLKVDNSVVEWKDDENQKRSYRDSCVVNGGPVDRIYCATCCTKMATVPVSDNDDKDNNQAVYINMGPLDEETVSDDLLKSWQTTRIQQSEETKAIWKDAVATCRHEQPPVTIKGGCGCGASKYQIQYHAPSEQQHCYCRLCRQFSGSAFQTWVPVPNQFFSWTTQEPDLIETTPHGRRHMCRHCGGVLTIVYDEQDDMIWPAAGGFDDETLPKDDLKLGRSCHICCRWKQQWYKLPDDGTERVDYAC